MDESNKNLLQIRAFTEPIVLKGFTYYDTHARAFNILRFPAIVKYLFPQIQKRKIKFEIRCFPDIEELRKYMENISDPPLIVNLLAREEG